METPQCKDTIDKEKLMLYIKGYIQAMEESKDTTEEILQKPDSYSTGAINALNSLLKKIESGTLDT